MGYSVAIRAKSLKDRKIILDFMDRNFVPANKLWNQVHNYCGIHEELAYDDCKLAVGFDFNCSDAERDLMFSTIIWMAVKFGKKIKVPKLTGLDEAVPYFVYDGCEVCPVLDISLKNETNRGNSYFVKNGFEWVRSKEALKWMLYSKKIQQLILKSVLDLDKKWEAENVNN